jgi:hypothetical protein
MSVSGYINKLDSKAAAAAKAKQVADQKASATAFKASGQTVSAFINKLDSVAAKTQKIEAAKTTANLIVKDLNNSKNFKQDMSTSKAGFVASGQSLTAYMRNKSSGGMIRRLAAGGFAMGTDIIPAMLTPGEFVVRKYAVDKFGADNLKAINRGENPSESVYNYEVNVNVATDANPDQIARSVITEIKRIDSQKIRGNRF